MVKVKEESTLLTTSTIAKGALLILLLASCGGNGHTTNSIPVHADGAVIDGGPSDDGPSLTDGVMPCPGVACDDGLSCTKDTLNEEDCTCSHTLRGRECSPDKACDCFADECPCEDLGPCLVGICDAALDTCTYRPFDRDGDGRPPEACTEVGGDDCDDADTTIYPGAPELCDGLDNDCDDEVDEDATPPCM